MYNPLNMSAYLYLKNNIEKGVFKIGCRFNESMIADELNMSRTPVRFALNKLMSEGVITYTRHKGYFLKEKKITLQEYTYLMDIMALLMSEIFDGSKKCSTIIEDSEAVLAKLADEKEDMTIITSQLLFFQKLISLSDNSYFSLTCNHICNAAGNTVSESITALAPHIKEETISHLGKTVLHLKNNNQTRARHYVDEYFNSIQKLCRV
ncbi:GntR family transcriptional regulator [Listeria grandensis]|uniref:GntR family transcriptional regulator n=1 Tax=Listeria grandensis TaxID=1494963 RepID=A0A7X1CPB7_9LIST|nr:GntR family transcriptional regulator [Listeria grandensis]MBC1935845.1 GntR family transcriptional regulator [Listeria grandensis]